MFGITKSLLKKRLIVSASVALLAVAGLTAIVYSQVGGIFPTVLTAYSASGSVTGQIVVSARLTRFFVGAPIGLSGCNLTFCVMAVRRHWVYTDSNGQARLTLARGTLPQTGTYYIAWQYDGNGVYSRPLSVSTVTVMR